MLYNATFWRGFFQSTFEPHLERTLDVLEHRLLPTFSGIDAEVSALPEKTYNDLISAPFDPDRVDEYDLANAAFEAAYTHYSGMDTVRQALVNSFAPMLYHTWEQQLLDFHRKEVLHPKEQRNNKYLRMDVLQARLMESGLDITHVPTWSKIDELRLVANTVKHADGGSGDRLKARRPELFDAQHANSGIVTAPLRYTPRVYRPMSGEDLYLTMADLRAYGRATIDFWSEFADALENA